MAGTTGFIPGAPDLAVEVISPSDTYTEVEEKVTLSGSSTALGWWSWSTPAGEA